MVSAILLTVCTMRCWCSHGALRWLLHIISCVASPCMVFVAPKPCPNYRRLPILVARTASNANNPSFTASVPTKPTAPSHCHMQNEGCGSPGGQAGWHHLHQVDELGRLCVLWHAALRRLLLCGLPLLPVPVAHVNDQPFIHCALVAGGGALQQSRGAG